MLNAEGRSHKLITLMPDASHVVSFSPYSDSVSSLIPICRWENTLIQGGRASLSGKRGSVLSGCQV